MIIDSHAPYSNHAYQKPFHGLAYNKDGYTLLPAAGVEQAAAENTIRLFELPVR